MALFTAAGTYTALVTPFSEDGTAVDWDALERHVERQIEGGVTGLVPCGTTGETPTLDWDEHHAIIKRTVEIARGRVEVLAGVGSNDTRTSVEAAQKAFADGADAAMVVVPYYNKPSQEGILRHVRAVAESVDGPVVLYNVPGRTACAVNVDTVCALAEQCKNLVAIKDASNNVHDAQRLRLRLGDRLRVLSGDDALTFPLMSVGATGVISVTSNVLPKAVSQVVSLMTAGEFIAARDAHVALLPVHDAMFCAPSPAPVKAALASQGHLRDMVRLPLVTLTPSQREHVVAALSAYENHHGHR